MKEIPDFNESELWVVSSTLEERYHQEIEYDLGEAEIRLHPGDRELTPCPVVMWHVGKTGFIIFKSGAERYRCQFFYRIHQQYGTGIEEYDNIAECVTSLLQVQADHIAELTPDK